MIEKTFTGEADFNALYTAEEWCRGNGISYGPMSSPHPIALLYGNFQIAKWKNLTAKERSQIDGKIESADFRRGPVRLTIKEKP